MNWQSLLFYGVFSLSFLFLNNFERIPQSKRRKYNRHKICLAGNGIAEVCNISERSLLWPDITRFYSDWATFDLIASNVISFVQWGSLSTFSMIYLCFILVSLTLPCETSLFIHYMYLAHCRPATWFAVFQVKVNVDSFHASVIFCISWVWNFARIIFLLDIFEWNDKLNTIFFSEVVFEIRSGWVFYLKSVQNSHRIRTT